MAKQPLLVLEQEDISVDGITYGVTAMSATDALMFMEKHLESVNSGKVDLSVVKSVIIKYVTKDNMSITKESFDVIFSRKVGHLQRLFTAVLHYNFEDPLAESDSED